MEAGVLRRVPFLFELGLQFVGRLQYRRQGYAHGGIPSAERFGLEGYRDYALRAQPIPMTHTSSDYKPPNAWWAGTKPALSDNPYPQAYSLSSRATAVIG